jgi:hypothetical protein
MNAQEIRSRLRKLADKNKAKVLKGFFKTGPGHYGEGDVFFGITVPVLRKVAKECDTTSLPDAVQLLRSAIHEERLLALLSLIHAYTNAHDSLKRKIYNLYLKNSRYINN